MDDLYLRICGRSGVYGTHTASVFSAIPFRANRETVRALELLINRPQLLSSVLALADEEDALNEPAWPCELCPPHEHAGDDCELCVPHDHEDPPPAVPPGTGPLTDEEVEALDAWALREGSAYQVALKGKVRRLVSMLRAERGRATRLGKAIDRHRALVEPAAFGVDASYVKRQNRELWRVPR